MGKVLFYLLVGFNLWMIIDAVRRRAELFWFVILILFGPLGSLLYFVMVKLKDYKLRAGYGASSEGQDEKLGPAPIGEGLLRRAEGARLDYADSLEAAGRHEEALSIFQELLANRSDEVRALHGQARCYLGLDRPGDAIESLERVMDLDKSYRDYAAALDYAEALAQAGRASDAVDLLEGLVSVTGRMNHQVALAHYLALDGRRLQAAQVLEGALSSYESLGVRERQRAERWAARAREMLEALASQG